MIFVRNVYEVLRSSSSCDWAVMGSGGQRDRGAVTCRQEAETQEILTGANKEKEIEG